MCNAIISIQDVSVGDHVFPAKHSLLIWPSLTTNTYLRVIRVGRKVIAVTNDKTGQNYIGGIDCFVAIPFGLGEIS